ncbi:MAG: DUF2336 domain-containing protein [Alphaproteobacteria bacterium]|nr:DUF2336 domain-containing protein [Alphaproteobacteria bacterium]
MNVGQPLPPTPLSYEQARDMAAAAEPRLRAELASRPDLPPEVLYYLASDTDAAVRLAVAGNPSTPAKGNLLLADDAEEGVRSALATKIGRHGHRAMPAKSQSVTRDVLDRLARDQIARVRAVIADALKDMPGVDHTLIALLARDSEIIVAAPILEYSPVLTDDDLLGIIIANPVEGALAAISRRAYVDPRVTAAIVASSDTRAITHMLKNANAHLQESTLDALIERAADEPAWQAPLVYRPELTENAAQRLAELVATHLFDRILARKDLPPAAVQAVAKVVQARLKEQAAQGAVEAPRYGPDIEDRYAPFLENARAQHAQGRLDEVALMVSLLTDREDDLVAGLAVRADLPMPAVLDMVASQSPQAMCALAWAAGLSALFAVELQLRLARIAMDSVMQPAKDGGHVLGESEMRWQIEMFRGA